MTRALRVTIALLSSLAVVALAGCGDDDGSTTADAGGDATPPPPDAGPPCESDGTALGDCMRFACEVEKASALHCAGTGFSATFNCAGIDGFPEDYQAMVRAYFGSCAPELAGLEDTEVMTGSGPLTVPACQILKCATEPLGSRMPTPMSIRAECAPVPAPECDFPDPPM